MVNGFSQISRVSQSRFCSGYVSLAVSIFIRSSLGVSIFYKAANDLEVPIPVCFINEAFSSLDNEF